MTYKITLKEQRAQLVVNELNNATRITSEPDQDGWVCLEIHLDSSYDALCLYHAGVAAKRQMDEEFFESKKVSVTVA